MRSSTKAPDRWEGFRDGQREEFADSIIAAVSDPVAGGLSVTEIVKRAGTSRKTFYKYFDSLSAAVIYTQKSVLRRFAVHAQAVASEASLGRERLLTVLQDQSTVATESPALFRFLSFFDFTFRHVGMAQDEQFAYDTAMQVLAADAIKIFREGQVDGSIRADLEPELTVGAMSGAMIGLIQRYLAITASAPKPNLLLEMAELEASAWRSYLSRATS